MAKKVLLSSILVIVSFMQFGAVYEAHAQANTTITFGTGAKCGSGAAFQQCGVLPANGGTYAYPLAISVVASSPNNINAWKVYVDGNEVTPDSTPNTIASTGGKTGVFNTTLSAAGTGTHTIGVNTWDGSNAVKVYQVTVTIEQSWLPTPTGTVYSFYNMQKPNTTAPTTPTNWGVCNGTCAEGSGGPTSGSSALQFEATADDSVAGAQESLSGWSLMESSTGASFDTLGYQHIPCPGTTNCQGLGNFLDDFWLYIPASDNGTMRALEFDPDLFSNSNGYSVAIKMSMQCDSASGNWQFWNEATGHWIPRDATADDPSAPTFSCAMTTSQDQWKTGTWHHFQLYGKISDEAGGGYTYETLVLDGEKVFYDLGFSCKSLAANEGQELNIEQQIDNETNAGTNSVYYDNYNVSFW